MIITEKNNFTNQYSELIDLITFYVNMQKALVDKILITVVNNKYIVMDKEKNKLFEMIEYDDSLLDLVVTLAPKKIEMYNILKFKNRELIKTIIQIFKERVDMYCESLDFE